jgi:hypothetical protein
VEALQCVKCALHHDLLFCEPGPSSSVEEPDEYNIETVPNKKPSDDDDDDEEGWEALFLEEDEDNSESDFVMED